MSDDYFTRLNTELAARTRRGAHLSPSPRRLLRRAATAGLVVVAIAVSLAAEFPASAYGRLATPSTTIALHVRA